MSSQSLGAPVAKDPIAQAFSRLLGRYGSRALVVSTAREVTADEIEALSRALGSQLGPQLETGSLVGLAIPNGPAFLAGFLALRRNGHPVALLDAAAPADDRARAAVMLGASSVLECRQPWTRSPDDYELVHIGHAITPCDLRDVAVVKLTSGSTGAPRGVALTGQALLADENALATTMGLSHDDRLLASLPWSHSYGFTTLVLSSLVRGLPLLMPRDDDPLAPVVDAAALSATILPTVPAYVEALVRMSRPPGLPPSVRLVISAGAPLQVATAKRFRELYGQPIHVFYGSSECGGICYDRSGGAGERGTVGTPVDGVRVTLSPIDDGDAQSGVVTVESAAVGVTYLPDADPRLTPGRFQTSDAGRWRDGELVVERRIDRVINVRGRKVDPGEVESVLLELAGIDEALVQVCDSRDRISYRR